MLKVESVFSAGIVIIFSSLCLLPGYWLGQKLADEFALVGAVHWLIITFAWCVVCGGLAAVATIIPAIIGGCRPRSLWLRAVAITVLTLVVAIVCLADQIKMTYGIIRYLVDGQQVDVVTINLIPEAAAATPTNPADDCRRGYDYLVNLAKRSGDDMHGVPSRYDPSKSVADSVDDMAVVAPFIIEHMSWKKFSAAKSQSAKAELVCRVLAEYSRRGSLAYWNEVNGNHLGPVQMSGGIYQDLRGFYTAAGLVADSSVGRRDHLSAAKATRLHMDSARVELSVAARKKVGEGEWLNRALIASHNLEAAQVSTAIVLYGTNWRLAEIKVKAKTKKGKKVTKCYPLHREAADYMDMYADGVYEVFKDFGAFDRPNS